MKHLKTALHFSFKACFLPSSFIALLSSCTPLNTEDGNGEDEPINVTITCDEPAIRQVSLSEPYTFQATLSGEESDLSSIQQVFVNDVPAQLDSDGRVSAEFLPDFGMRFFFIEIPNETGNSISRTCTELHSETFLPETDFLDEGFTLELRQSFLDDNRDDPPYRSLAALASTALNSPELANLLAETFRDTELTTVEIDVPLLGKLSITLTVGNIQFDGVDAFNLSLSPEGPPAIQISSILRDLSIDIKLSGSLNTTANATVHEGAQISATIPIVATDEGRFNVEISDLALSDIDIDILLDLDPSHPLKAPLENLISDLITGLVDDDGLLSEIIIEMVQQEVGKLISDLLIGLPLDNLINGLKVPHPLGGEPMELSFGFLIDSVVGNGEYIGFNIAPRFIAPLAPPPEPIEISNIPIPPDYPSDTPVSDEIMKTSNGIFASVHTGVANQAIHAFWRGGYFDFELTSDTLLELLNNFDIDIGGIDIEEMLSIVKSIQVEAKLPPVVDLPKNNELRLGLGAISTTVVLKGNEPGNDTPILIEFGTSLRGTVSTNEDSEIQIQMLGVDDIAVSEPEDIVSLISLFGLEISTWSELRGIILQLIEVMGINLINDLIPAISIPSFKLPSEAQDIGLNGNIQIYDLQLGLKAQRLNIAGGIELQPESHTDPEKSSIQLKPLL